MLQGLTENHARSLLASVQYAAKLIRDCDDVLAGATGTDPLSKYTKALSAPQERIARDYLARLNEQLLRALRAVGIAPPPPSISAVHALHTIMMFLDDAFEEMRGRNLAGYGKVPPEADRVLDGVVSELQELARDFTTFLTGVSDDVIRRRLERLAPTQPLVNDLRELARIIAGHGLVDLRPALGLVVDRALENTFDVAVIGRVSSGKSSLLNALLGAPVLPTGVLPVTAFPTRLRRGPEARLQVAYADGRAEITEVARIAEFVSESGNPGNEKRLTRLLLTYPSDMLPADVTFVDTPGLGSVTAASALQTYTYLPRCDHATFLFDATAPVAEEDLTVLAFLHDAGITTSILLSKADLLNDGDLERVRVYVAAQIERRLKSSVPVRAMSTVAGQESLLQNWIRDEVRPLGRQARQHAHEALARKIRVLRDQAIVSLERQRGGTRSALTSEQSASIVAALRDMSARLERASRDLFSLQDGRHELVEAALTAATDALANDQNTALAGEMLRSTLVRGAHEIAERVTRNLDALSHEAEATLAAAARATDGSAPVLDLSARSHDTPLLDLPPLTLELHPRLWAKASRHLMHRWIDDRVHEAWQPVVERSAEAYLDVLRRWATDALTDVRRQYESASRPLLTQLTGTVTRRHGATTGTSALEHDLEWLRHEHLETTDARH